VRLGIFGGTFDPPHIGHLILAADAQEQLKLDRVLWVLTLKPPHKHGKIITALQDRLDMVRATIDDNPMFELSRIEIDRPAPHFAADTVRLLGKENPRAELVYLMGGDSLGNLLTWYRVKKFVGGCQEIGVLRRPDDHIDLKRLESQIPGIIQKIRFVDAPLIDVAASKIRDRIISRRPYRYYVHCDVYKIIKDRKLYQE